MELQRFKRLYKTFLEYSKIPFKKEKYQQKTKLEKIN